jgi:hypothetical protein
MELESCVVWDFSSPDNYCMVWVTSNSYSLKGYGNIFFYYFTDLEELLKLYVNLFYRFCVTLLFLEIFEQKKSQISELSAILGICM